VSNRTIGELAMKTSRLALAISAAAAIAACSKSAPPGAAAGQPGGDAAAAATVGDDKDPCRLVTQAEAEHWLGPLAHAPFRSDDPGNPTANGKNCKFLGQDGRYILMEVDWTNGKIGMKAMSMMGGLVGTIFTDDAGKSDTLEGGWDEARWLGAGSEFFALKDDVLITAKVAAAKDPIPTAADLSSKALGRVGHQLAYNGGQAATDAPHPRETGDACGLLTNADIEAIVGDKVEGAPVPSGRGSNTGCAWKVQGKELKLDVSWSHGFENFAGGKLVMGTVMNQTAGMPGAHGKTGEGAKTEGLKQGPGSDPGFQKMMGALQKLAKTQGIAMNEQGGLVNDTLVEGPWAEGAILGGMSFAAVKNDVQVIMGFQALSIEQAKALMAKVMERL
jgi:hypothetical protein